MSLGEQEILDVSSVALHPREEHHIPMETIFYNNGEDDSYEKIENISL